MGIDEHLRIDRIHSDAPPAKDAGKPSDPDAFRSILEQLEAVGKTREGGGAPDVDDLQRAMQKADDEFQTVMDLRRALEEAYRKRE